MARPSSRAIARSGTTSATQVFKDALKELGLLFPERAVHDPEEAFIQENRALFSELRRRWFPPIPDPDRAIDASIERLAGDAGAVPRHPGPRGLVRELVPELGTRDSCGPERVAATNGCRRTVGSGDDTRRLRRSMPIARGGPQSDGREVAEVTTVGQMLQVMENAWIALRMDTHRDHPMHRGG